MSGPVRTHPRHRARRALARHAAWLAGLVTTAALLAACSDEPTPNHVPEVVAGSPTVSCEDLNETNLDPVLAGGSIQLIDENLVSVTVEVGGLETIALSGPPVDPEADPDLPQTWTFTVDTARRLVCSADLVLIFTAVDEKGDSAVAAVASK